MPSILVTEKIASSGSQRFVGYQRCFIVCIILIPQLMGEEPDLDPEITKEFFEANILQFDPSLLTENGMT
jgi:hypothetical protein